jgi:copper chaperone NosL
MTITAFCLLGLLLTSFVLGAEERVALKPTAKDKCPICGMFVAKYPDWTTAILFKGGSNVFFDGTKDMFKYLLDPKRYDSARRKEDIAAVMVKEYYGLSLIDARKAWYVLGSDVFGPMGRELIALETEADAKEFMKDHKGTKIIRFSEVVAEVMKTID